MERVSGISDGCLKGQERSQGQLYSLMVTQKNVSSGRMQYGIGLDKMKECRRELAKIE